MKVRITIQLFNIIYSKWVIYIYNFLVSECVSGSWVMSHVGEYKAGNLPPAASIDVSVALFCSLPQPLTLVTFIPPKKSKPPLTLTNCPKSCLPLDFSSPSFESIYSKTVDPLFNYVFLSFSPSL